MTKSPITSISKRHVAADAIVECHGRVAGHAEAKGGRFARAAPSGYLGVGQVAAAADVLRRLSRRQRTLPIRLELLRRAEAVVGAARRTQSLRVLLIEVGALGLTVRAVRTADVGALVPRQAEPAEVVENRALGLGRRSLASVSSMRRMNAPPCPRASSQL